MPNDEGKPGPAHDPVLVATAPQNAGAARPPIRINIDQLHIALVWRDPGSTYVLDLQTGEVFLHHYNADAARDAEVRTHTERYHPIRPIDPKHSYQAVADFVEFLPESPVRNQLRATILGKGAFRRFKDFVAGHPAEKELWLIFKEQREMSYVEQWLALLPYPHEPYDPFAERRKARLDSIENLRSKRVRIRRVDHLHLRVQDLAAARDFYQELLQLPAAETTPLAAPGEAGSCLRCGNLELHLVHDPQMSRAESGGAPALAFEVASLAQARQALESAGVAVGPEEVLPGGRRALLEDPSGNRIELLEPAAAIEAPV